MNRFDMQALLADDVRTNISHDALGYFKVILCNLRSRQDVGITCSPTNPAVLVGPLPWEIGFQIQ